MSDAVKDKRKLYAVAAVLMVLGVVVTAIVKGSSGTLVGIFLVSLGGILLLLLVCFEVRPWSGDEEPAPAPPPAHDRHTGERRLSEQAQRDEDRRRAQTHRPEPRPSHGAAGDVRPGRRVTARPARRPRRPS